MYSFEKFRMTYHEEIRQFPLHFVGGFAGDEVVGWGAIKMTGVKCKEAGITHAILVTTGLKGTGIVDEIQSITRQAGVETTIFKVGQTNPRLEDVAGGVAAFKDSGADGLLSVGGGSSHDTAKLIRVKLANPDKELNDVAVRLDPHFSTIIPTLKPSDIPQVAVNTTAGTGAEMTGFGVVTDWQQHWKFPIVSGGMLPVIGIMDPACLRTMPEHIAAQTGIDCFVHAMDGYIGRLNNQAAKALGAWGAKMCWENLAEFTYNRQNDKACEGMAWAQYISALTYAMGGGGGLTHALGHQLSAINNLHHGLANALTMVPCVKWCYGANPTDYGDLAKYVFDVDTSNMNRMQAAESFIEKTEEFRNIVGISDVKLSSYGIKEEDCKHVMKNCVNDLNYENSPRDTTEEQVFKILKDCL